MHRLPAVALALVGVAVLVIAGLPAPPAAAVAGGQESEPGAWPWQVALLVDGGVWCGGTLLEVDVVLTAAHCTDGMRPSDFTVLAGSVDIHEGDGQRLGVAAIDQHEGYDDVQVRNDLALLTLERAFDLGPFVDLVTLADAEQTAAFAEGGDPAVVTGFGATGEDAPASDVLREAEIEVVDDAECVADYRQDGDSVFGDSQVCAGVDRGHIDACYGDSGGPLVVPVDDQRSAWIQVGIVSWGAGCGQPNRPTVYTQVAAFTDWLASRGVGPDGAQRYDGGGARLPARGSRGKASHYPLRVEVEGFEGAVTRVSVRLLGLTHERPEDLDIWLVAPSGDVVTLLSDVGGTDAIRAASVLVVDGANPASGFELAPQVAPSDREADDERKGARASGELAALAGIDPNGEWQLLIGDDRRGARGNLDGWTLQLS